MSKGKGKKTVAEVAPEQYVAQPAEEQAVPLADQIVTAVEEHAAEAHQSKPAEPPATPGTVNIQEIIKRHLESVAQEKPSLANVAVARSTVAHPVKLVHSIASEMTAKNPGVQRKDIIAECEKAGIATHTARTQYQIWSAAMKADRERDRLAAEKPKAPAPTQTGALSARTRTGAATPQPPKRIKFPRG